MSLPIKGELGYGDLLGLAFGVVANWSSGAAQTLFTAPTGISGAVLTVAVARSPTGTQPLSYQIKVNGTAWGSAVTLSGLTSGLVLPLLTPSGMQVVAAPAQSITVTPLAAAAGTCTFDLQGYFF